MTNAGRYDYDIAPFQDWLHTAFSLASKTTLGRPGCDTENFVGAGVKVGITEHGISPLRRYNPNGFKTGFDS
ncbi:uncharacterized protein Z518_03709 [Rhinocladiella mackenziei CBS 650.93]|uniref:Uncharacterized protein n=1 Tax=Rhinocladiella mackenziei CBS 650.93 TaxID=1442369 RepID=A0A0D2FUF6_9EURO|nr:uncharacterized protein Z518_03709 [Rhinocladiella mackenziei CBS 650.93]KIX05737.1 hypothetical protein Z518_03709 [Rhinocladiella mackenziei CBS 650.93]